MVIQDIHDLIKFGIHVYGITYLPGIGTLRIQRAPASYALDKKTILPPSSTLIFEDRILPDHNIIALGQTCGFKADSVELWLKDLLLSLNNNSSSITLRGVGILEKKDDQYYFQAEPKANWNGFRDWPVIKIEPLIQQNRNYEFAISQPKELILPWKKKEVHWKSFIFPFIAISVVGFFLILRSCSHQDSENNFSQIKEKNGNNFESKVDSNARHSTLADTAHSMDVDSNQNIQIPNTYSNPSEDNLSAFYNADSTCIFIVGSFLKSNNAKKLKKKLSKEGYTVNIYENRPFYRVGFSMPCTAIGQLPKTILKNYPDVWLLEP